MTFTSLQQTHTKRIDIPLLLVTSLILLIAGLFLPVIDLKEMVFWKSSFSVTSGISNLFKEGYYILGIIILFFSIVFPIFKLTVLSMIWFSKLTDETRNNYLYWLGLLGKWSMLDVFVIAVTIVITKISRFAEAEPKMGLYFFGTSILIAMITTELISKLIHPKGEHN